MTKKATKEVTLDRRTAKASERRDEDRRKKSVAVAEERRTTERRKTPRRRQIDPTTCEREYTPEEIEFMQAMDMYKRRSGRMFPTCSEILEVIRDLGYVRTLASSGMQDATAESLPTSVEATDTATSA